MMFIFYVLFHAVYVRGKSFGVALRVVGNRCCSEYLCLEQLLLFERLVVAFAARSEIPAFDVPS
jgi:hypothetical protein